MAYSVHSVSPIPINKIKEQARDVLSEYFQTNEAIGRQTDRDVVEIILVGLALKLSTQEILFELNAFLESQGRPILQSINIRYYRKQYAKVIDELWVRAYTNISDIHRFTDKVYRLGVYDHIANGLTKSIIPQVDAGRYDDEGVQKGLGLLLKTLRAINEEMGGVTYKDMIALRDGVRPDEAEVERPDMSLADAQGVIAAVVEDRFGAQLPEKITQKFSFTDFENCAFGEKLGGKVVCWNDKMTSGNLGGPCSVLEGKCQICPKFLNKTLIDSKQWLRAARTGNRVLVKDIARMAGNTEYDPEVRAKVVYYMMKHNVLKNQQVKDLESFDESEAVELTESADGEEQRIIDERASGTTDRATDEGEVSILPA